MEGPMQGKMPPKKGSKRGREEGSVQRKKPGSRIGVSLRADRGKWVVEMRVPNWPDYKLQFGSYNNKHEAMVARDYATFLRISAGEAGATAGGFGAHCPFYEFEESPTFFERLGVTRVRRGEYETMDRLYRQQKPKGKSNGMGVKNPSHQAFCERARKDVLDAMGMFQETFPDKFGNSQTANSLLSAETFDVLSTEPFAGDIQATALQLSSSEARVSPEPVLAGGTLGDGASDINFSDVQLLVVVNGVSLQTSLHMIVPVLANEQILEIINARMAKIRKELLKKVLEELGPCPVNPLDIPPLE